MTETTTTRVVDLQPLRLVMRTLLRWSWLILLGAFAVLIVAVAALSDNGPESARAEARLGLTEEVVWPFYDAARDRVDVLVDSDAFVSRVEATAGVDNISMELETPINQTYVDLVVLADNQADAEAARDAAAAEITEESLDSRRTRLEAERDALQADLDEAEVLVADVEQSIDDAIAEQVLVGQALIANPDDIELRTRDRQLDSVRSRLITQRDGHVRTVQSLERSRDEIVRELDSLQPEVELLRLSSAEGADESSALPALAAAFLAAIAISLAVVIWDRERGPLRDEWYVEGPVGLPLVGSIHRADTDSPEGLATVADRIMYLAGPGPIGVVGTPGLTAEALIDLVDPMLDGAVKLIDLDDEYADPDRLRPETRTCESIILACRETQRVHHTRSLAETVSDAGGQLMGVVLVNGAE